MHTDAHHNAVMRILFVACKPPRLRGPLSRSDAFAVCFQGAELRLSVPRPSPRVLSRLRFESEQSHRSRALTSLQTADSGVSVQVREWTRRFDRSLDPVSDSASKDSVLVKASEDAP